MNGFWKCRFEGPRDLQGCMESRRGSGIPVKDNAGFILRNSHIFSFNPVPRSVLGKSMRLLLQKVVASSLVPWYSESMEATRCTWPFGQLRLGARMTLDSSVRATRIRVFSCQHIWSGQLWLGQCNSRKTERCHRATLLEILNPQGSKDPNNGVLGPKYYTINGIWSLKP